MHPLIPIQNFVLLKDPSETIPYPYSNCTICVGLFSLEHNNWRISFQMQWTPQTKSKPGSTRASSTTSCFFAQCFRFWQSVLPPHQIRKRNKNKSYSFRISLGLSQVSPRRWLEFGSGTRSIPPDMGQVWVSQAHNPWARVGLEFNLYVRCRSPLVSKSVQS